MVGDLLAKIIQTGDGKLPPYSISKYYFFKIFLWGRGGA